MFQTAIDLDACQTPASRFPGLFEAVAASPHHTVICSCEIPDVPSVHVGWSRAKPGLSKLGDGSPAVRITGAIPDARVGQGCVGRRVRFLSLLIQACISITEPRALDGKSLQKQCTRHACMPFWTVSSSYWLACWWVLGSSSAAGSD